MPVQFLLLIFPVIFNFKAIQTNIPVSHSYSTNTTQDSLPPLHTIQGNEISNVTTSFEDAAVIVTLKNQMIYTYHRADWDYEDYFPSTVQVIKDAITRIKITFTKAEHMPGFPGGMDMWEKYLKEFCFQHQKDIDKYGPGEFSVSFIVHVHGQVSDISVTQGGTGSKLSSLAVDCIKSGPAWLPAIQHGHPVPCYQTQVVKL